MLSINILKRAIAGLASRLGYHVGILPPVANDLGAHLAVLFDALGTNCVLDVGANIGQYGRFLRNIAYEGRIVSFEPIEEHVEELYKVADADGNWRVRQLALGEYSAEECINVTRSGVLSSFRAPSDYGHDTMGQRIETAQTQLVAVSTLAEEWKNAVDGLRESRVHLKLDTQGWNFQVLQGGADVLASVSSLQVELPYRRIYAGTIPFVDALKRIEDLGFCLSAIFPLNVDRRFHLLEAESVWIRD